MATRTSHPGRTLIIFLLVIVGMFAWCAAIGEWKPKLGLDLQGGQRITLKATTTTGGGITKEKLDEAAGIISQRVNGVGVAESEVSTQGSNIIVVEVPGEAKEGLADTIGSTAQLRFRLESLHAPGRSAPQTAPQDRPRPIPRLPVTTDYGTRPAERAAPSTQTPSGGADRQPGHDDRQEPPRCCVARDEAEGSCSHDDCTGRRGSDRAASGIPRATSRPVASRLRSSRRSSNRHQGSACLGAGAAGGVAATAGHVRLRQAQHSIARTGRPAGSASAGL